MNKSKTKVMVENDFESYIYLRQRYSSRDKNQHKEIHPSLACKPYKLSFDEVMFPSIVGESLISVAVAPSSSLGVDGREYTFLTISSAVCFFNIMTLTSFCISITAGPGCISLIIEDAVVSMDSTSRSDNNLRYKIYDICYKQQIY